MEHTNKYYSQYGQDKWLHERYFIGKTDGVFMEIGCMDGVHLSNTLFFEKLGWSGICIEASPIMFEKMIKNRKCICENIAVSNYVGTTEFMDITGYSDGLSGIVEDYHPSHQVRINHEMNISSNENSIIDVKVDLVNNVLESHNIYHIDFATIDTEGSEFNILKAIDFDKFNIDVIMVENNYSGTNVREFMLKNNYLHIGRINIDDIYIKNKANKK